MQHFVALVIVLDLLYFMSIQLMANTAFLWTQLIYVDSLASLNVSLNQGRFGIGRI